MVGRIVLFGLIGVCLCSHLFAQDLEVKSYKKVDELIKGYYRSGQYQEAILATNLLRERAKVDYGVQDSVYNNYTANLGFFHHKTGQYEKAEAFYLEAQSFALEAYGKESEEYTTNLNNLANLYRKTGEYEMAKSLFGEVKNLDKKLFGTKSQQYASSLNNLALLYMDQRSYNMAEPLLLRSKDIREAYYGKKHRLYASSLNNLAGLYMMMQRYDEAADLYIESNKLRVDLLGEKHQSNAESLHNLASLYRLEKKYKKGEGLYLKALEIEKETVGINHPLYINTLNKLALLYHLDERDSLAWAFLEKALRAATQEELSIDISEAWKEHLLSLDLNSYLSLNQVIESLDIAYQLLEKGTQKVNYQGQVLILDAALALLQRGRNGFFNYKDKLRLLAISNDWILRQMSLLDQSTEGAKAFEIAEQNKSVLLMEASQAQAAYQMGNLPDSLVELEQEIASEQEQIYNKLQDKRAPIEKDSLREILNQLNKRRKLFKTNIERKYPAYANLKYQQNYVTATEVQALLEKDEAMIEYVIGDSSLYIVYIDKKELRFEEVPIRKNELTEQIKKMHQVLSNYNLLSKREKDAYRIYSHLAHWFYKNLLFPVLKTSKEIKKLIFITDGELGHLPFEAFLVEAAPQQMTDYGELHYLLNDYIINYNYSASLWKENKIKKAPVNNREVLGITANYEFLVDSSRNFERLPVYQRIRENLDTLPNAKEEVLMLSKQFKGNFMFNEFASENIFKREANKFAVIHLAMHGLLNSKTPMLSSLVFTEDGDSLENNFLQAYEISKLKLNANLVVLSACETGFGKFEKGNGIASLARSFMYAGASSLVVSLWQVNDFSTAEIMKLFYQNLGKGMEKGAALRAAKLSYIKEVDGLFRHPAFWSPFIQMGTTDSIDLETKGKRSLVWWGLAILGCSLLLIFLRKKTASLK